MVAAVSDTKIPWTEKTWNPVRGCSPASAGCDHCYAAANAGRFEPALVNAIGQFNGTIRCLPKRLKEPLRWRKPKMVFVPSMGDLFHDKVPSEFIHRVLQTIRECPHHTFQILTKRTKRLRQWAQSRAWPVNVWLGATVEECGVLNRIVDLRALPAHTRFLSCEPLLGPLDELPLDGIHWVIVGGETGPGARLCKVEWIRSIVKQCKAAGVAVFVKQLGSHNDGGGWSGVGSGWTERRNSKHADPLNWPVNLRVREYPKAVGDGA